MIVQKHRQKLMIATQYTGTLAGSPQFTRADAPTKHTTLCKWTGGAQNSGTLRCIVGKIPPICFAFSAPTLRPKVFTAFVGFVFFSLSFGSRSPLILNSLCKNIKKDNPLDLIDTKPSAPSSPASILHPWPSFLLRKAKCFCPVNTTEQRQKGRLLNAVYNPLHKFPLHIHSVIIH